MNTYEDSFKIDGACVVDFVVVEDGGSELRNVVAAVALAGDVEVAVLVLREPLKPVDEERQGVRGGALVSVGIVIRGSVRVRESDADRRFEEDYIGH